MASIKMINETIPVYLLSKYGTIFQITSALGYLFVLGLGVGLPPGDYDPALVDNY